MDLHHLENTSNKLSVYLDSDNQPVLFEVYIVVRSDYNIEKSLAEYCPVTL